MFHCVKSGLAARNMTFTTLCKAYVTRVTACGLAARATTTGHFPSQICRLPNIRLSTAAQGSPKDGNMGGLVGSLVEPTPAAFDQVIDATDELTAKEIGESLRLFPNFISEEEEKSLFDEIEPYLKRMKYEMSHWDDAIYGYRETERKQWTQKNKTILQRVRNLAFPPGTPQLTFVHVLDVMATGAVKSHIDSVRFCGNTIAGMCLLSTAVMRFTHDKDKSRYADALLTRRSLYIMQGKSRYDYAHEVLGAEQSKFKGQVVPRDRRISVICRNEPSPEQLQ